jgi:hypothetical protein
MKLQRSLSIEIQRTAQDVFDYLDDFQHDPEWRTAVIEMRKTSPGPYQVNSTHVEVRKMGGRIIESPSVVTAHIPGQLISFQRASGPIRPIGAYLFEPIANGTKLTFRLEVPLNGGWILTLPLVQLFLSFVMRGAVTEFATLKRLLET